MEQIPLDFFQGDLLLMPFPYSDLSGKKVRPVVVVSNDQFNTTSQDLIVCCVTSNVSKEFYTVMLSRKEVLDGKLFEDCCIKVENIAKIEKSQVIKKIGRIQKNVLTQVLAKMELLFW